MIALIDADILLYQTVLAVSEEAEFDDEIVGPYLDMKQAREQLLTTAERWRELAGCDALAFYLSDLDNSRSWRRRMYPPYKANRIRPKPMGYGLLREWLECYATCHWFETLEADDAIAIAHTRPSEEPTVVVSEDKDFFQLPGLFFRTQHAEEGVLEITPEEGERSHLVQTLSGDRSDNYPGCPTVGPVKADRLLPPSGRWDRDLAWTSVVLAYEKQGLTEMDALLQARLAHLQRHGQRGPWVPSYSHLRPERPSRSEL